VTHPPQQQDSYREARERQKHEDNIKIVSALNRVADELTVTEKQQNRSDRCRAIRECISIVLILGTVVAAGAGDYCFYRQFEEMKSAGADTQRIINANNALAQAAKDQAAAEKASAKAIEIEATSSRAWLFVSYDVPQGPQVVRNSISLNFSIANVGHTPAIITNIETHLFVSTGSMFFTDGPAIITLT